MMAPLPGIVAVAAAVASNRGSATAVGLSARVRLLHRLCRARIAGHRRCASSSSNPPAGASRGSIRGERPRCKSPTAIYTAQVEAQQIALDRAQFAAVQQLQRLADELAEYEPVELNRLDAAVIEGVTADKRARAMAANRASEEADNEPAGPEAGPNDSGRQPEPAVAAGVSASASAEACRPATPPPKGVYVWGPVGSGKTMVVDMFFDAVRVHDDRKQRVHFHSFMRDVFRHVHALSTRSSGELKECYDHNLLRPLAKSIAKQSYLLCFDEVQIPDIGTASILFRLFEYLHEYVPLRLCGSKPVSVPVWCQHASCRVLSTKALQMCLIAQVRSGGGGDLKPIAG